MFQFSRFAHYMHPFFKWIGFPIRKSADQVIFADPRGLSQLITSFFASESQGIPRVPFLTFFYLCRLLLGKVCLLILVVFISSFVYRFIGLATSLPIYSCSSKAPTVLYTVVFSFNLLLPICQRTFCFGSFVYQFICSLVFYYQWTIQPVNLWTPAWWRITDSNRWPPACKAGALASWANPPSDVFKWQVLVAVAVTTATFHCFCYLKL